MTGWTVLPGSPAPGLSIPVTQLHAELDRLPAGAWSLPSTIETTGVHHRYRQVALIEAGNERKPWFRFAFEQFAPVWSAWLSCIDPGGFIRPHCDGGAHRERWQIPIRTAGTFDQNGESTAQHDGVPFRVRHWEPHAVRNDSDHPRVHLVFDRDVIVNPDPSPFRLCEEK